MNSTEARAIAIKFVQTQFTSDLIVLSCGRIEGQVNWEEVLSKKEMPTDVKRMLLAELVDSESRAPHWRVDFIIEFSDSTKLQMISVDIDESSGLASFDVRYVDYMTKKLREFFGKEPGSSE